MKSFVILLSFVWLTGCVRPDGSIPVIAPDSYAGIDQTDFLIYQGPGAWRAEITSIKNILYKNGSTYESLSPDEINQLSLRDFKKYRAIIFAGGSAPTVRKSLHKNARINIRDAVQLQGLNYIGFCAGAWLAVAPEPNPGEDVAYGLGVIVGPLLETNYLQKKGLENALDEAIFPNGIRRKLLWYGGPITLNAVGSVVAKYSDGSPAISQIRSGKGMVIISGLHPAATKSILNYLNLYEHEAIAPELAWALLEATKDGATLATF